MIFSSLLFLTVFLPIFLIGYFILPKQYKIKNIYLLLASFLFYAWGEPKFVIILFFATIIDFFLVKKMDTYESPIKRKIFLALPIMMNVGLLFYFKYMNFFIGNLNSFAELFSIGNIHILKIILPIGISFYTFESITYAVDVYRKIHKPLHKFWEYQMYIIFFPKLIAGPIVTYHEIADQLSTHIQNETFRNMISGFIRFCIGLSKKVLIANVVARQADAIFAMNNHQLNTPIAWIGILAYTMQIYFDFSGYSDMAIGISRMLGIKLPENFNNPYISKSITEFWRRWHITLGSWMRNYLYIPLGGNRVNHYRVLFNLFIVFILSGFWHGANWNFIIWGVYYGLFLVVERLLRNIKKYKIQQFIGIIYTFIVVVVGWVIFRLENIDKVFYFVKKMFAFDFNHDYVFMPNADFFPFFILSLLFSFSALIPKISQIQDKLFYGKMTNSQLILVGSISAILFFICIVSLSGGQFNPFIYFKF